VFASPSSPELFGFVGYVILPYMILTGAIEVIARAQRPENASKTADDRAAWLKARISAASLRYPPTPDGDFAIFYGTRQGCGMPGRSAFAMYRIKGKAGSAKVSSEKLEIPFVSSVLRTEGTGKASVDEWQLRWERSDQGNTSRTMFSAFCDALASGSDTKTGGEPQLVGLYREGHARLFGVVTKNGYSVSGDLNPEIAEGSVAEWRDSLFQRVDRNGRVLKRAQRQVRPRNV